MWGQRSWQGLAGATGEQMRTVGVRFNLDKRYRMQSAAVPRKDKMNFSHCASDSSFQWVERRRQNKKWVKENLFFLWGLLKLTNTHIHVHTRPCHQVCRYYHQIPTHNTQTEWKWLKCSAKMCLCVCSGVKEKIPNLAWMYFLSRQCMWVAANTLLCMCMFVC